MALGRIARAFFVTTGTLGGPGAALGVQSRFFGLSPVRLPIAVLVLEHAAREGALPNVTLVDTGWSADQVRAPLRALGATALFMDVKAREGDDVGTQLRARGIQPFQVKRIVATHLHVDHVGGLVDFPEAEVVTSEAELRSARERGSVHGFDVAALSKIGRWTVREIAGPSRYELPASLDLDDDLVLLDVRGHTAGAVGVAARVGDATLVHLGDAAYTLGEARRGEPSPLARRTSWDLERQRVTYRAINRLLARTDVTVLTSHDPESWRLVADRVFERNV